MFTRRWWWPVTVVAAVFALLVPVHTLQSNPVQLSGYGAALLGRMRAVNAADATADVGSALVLINSDISYQGAVGAGTGIVLSSDGVVLTNNHVVEGATKITATSTASGSSYPATVLGYDRKHDIALLQLQGASHLPTAPLGDGTHVAVGDEVSAVGNARGEGLSRSAGTVTGLNQTITAADDLAAPEQLTGLIEVSANVVPGDSGGALVNSSGQVIGIDTAASGNYRLSRGGGDGFAIPIGAALSIASQIQSGRSSGSVHVGPSAMLGVGVKTQRQGGVAVAQVLRGSPAQRAGIVPGDLITGFAGESVASDTALTDLLDQQHPGNGVHLTWVDPDGQQYSAAVTLAPGPVG
jgi:S1-C subfamily serine protease